MASRDDSNSDSSDGRDALEERDIGDVVPEAQSNPRQAPPAARRRILGDGKPDGEKGKEKGKKEKGSPSLAPLVVDVTASELTPREIAAFKAHIKQLPLPVVNHRNDFAYA